MWQEEPRYERGDYIFAWEEHVLFMLKQKEKNLAGPMYLGIKSQLRSGWGVWANWRDSICSGLRAFTWRMKSSWADIWKDRWCVWQKKTHMCWVRVGRWSEDESNFPSSISQIWTNMIRVMKSQMGNFRFRSPQIKMLPSCAGVDEIIRFWEKREKEMLENTYFYLGQEGVQKYMKELSVGGCGERWVYWQQPEVKL